MNCIRLVLSSPIDTVGHWQYKQCVLSSQTSQHSGESGFFGDGGVGGGDVHVIRRILPLLQHYILYNQSYMGQNTPVLATRFRIFYAKRENCRTLVQFWRRHDDR
jgi:hypothetical protein